jgi:hypothetical protein
MRCTLASDYLVVPDVEGVVDGPAPGVMAPVFPVPLEGGVEVPAAPVADDPVVAEPVVPDVLAPEVPAPAVVEPLLPGLVAAELDEPVAPEPVEAGGEAGVAEPAEPELSEPVVLEPDPDVPPA